MIYKIDDYIWDGCLTIPRVYFKIINEFDVPNNIDEYDRIPYLRIHKVPNSISDNGMKPGVGYYYDVLLWHKSKRSIPKDIYYLGNFINAAKPNDECIDNHCVDVEIWKHFEEFITNTVSLDINNRCLNNILGNADRLSDETGCHNGIHP